ncbi:MAG: hypothetical protein ACK57U_13250, partial [Planctomycetota bacterium]
GDLLLSGGSVSMAPSVLRFLQTVIQVDTPRICQTICPQPSLLTGYFPHHHLSRSCLNSTTTTR